MTSAHPGDRVGADAAVVHDLNISPVGLHRRLWSRTRKSLMGPVTAGDTFGMFCLLYKSAGTRPEGRGHHPQGGIMSAVVCDDVVKQYQDVRAVDGVSFEIH